jgi:DNA-binding protein
MVKKIILSHNAMDKIIREAGALRVSDSAKKALSEILKEKGLKIANEARKLAEHAGRKTVTDEDIKLAVEKY